MRPTLRTRCGSRRPNSRVKRGKWPFRYEDSTAMSIPALIAYPARPIQGGRLDLAPIGFLIGFLDGRGVVHGFIRFKVMEDAPVYRIVLTSGPCGGKSTALSQTTDRLQGSASMSIGFPFYVGNPTHRRLKPPATDESPWRAVFSSWLHEAAIHKRKTTFRGRYSVRRRMGGEEQENPFTQPNKHNHEDKTVSDPRPHRLAFPHLL